MCKDGTIPFELSRDIVVIVILDDGTNRVQSSDLQFTVTLIDPCLFDTIVFDETLSTIDYEIGTAGLVFEGFPIYSHTYALCPVECTLAMEEGGAIAPSLGEGLNL